jgi:hypothetical protein
MRPAVNSCSPCGRDITSACWGFTFLAALTEKFITWTGSNVEKSKHRLTGLWQRWISETEHSLVKLAYQAHFRDET